MRTPRTSDHGLINPTRTKTRIKLQEHRRFGTKGMAPLMCSKVTTRPIGASSKTVVRSY